MAYSGPKTRHNSRFQNHDSYAHISEALGLMRGPKRPPKVFKNDFFYKNDHLKQND